MGVGTKDGVFGDLSHDGPNSSSLLHEINKYTPPALNSIFEYSSDAHHACLCAASSTYFRRRACSTSASPSYSSTGSYSCSDSCEFSCNFPHFALSLSDLVSQIDVYKD